MLVHPALVLTAGSFLLTGSEGLFQQLLRSIFSLLTLGLIGTLLWLPEGPHFQLEFASLTLRPLVLDGYARILSITFIFLGLLNEWFGLALGNGAWNRRLSVIFCAFAASAALAGDWLTFFVFWELMAVAASVLIAGSSSETISVGFHYALVHEIGGLLLLAGILIQFSATATLTLSDPITSGVGLLLMVIGIGVNAAFPLLHFWLPEAYPAVDPVTSVVLSAFTTKIGIYALLKAVPVGMNLLVYIGCGMVFFGVTWAISQRDMRRLLSYHIISQVGYMVVGIGVGTTLARSGTLFHAVNNILYKSLLFMVAGIITYQLGTGNVKEIHGNGRTIRWIFPLFLVGALSISGVPGFNGFVSKAMLFKALEAEGFNYVLLLLFVGSVGTVLSFSKFGYYVFFGGRTEIGETTGTPLFFVLASSTLASFCILLGIRPGLFGLVSGSAYPVKLQTYLTVSKLTQTGLILLSGTLGFVLIKSWLAKQSPLPDIIEVTYSLSAIVCKKSIGVIDGGLSLSERGVKIITEGLGPEEQTSPDQRPELSSAYTTFFSWILGGLLLLGFLIM